MLNVRPFRGVRFDWGRVPLGAAVCPPYDVIPPRLARRLRALPHNTIHLELPAGGPRSRYLRAQRTWRRWIGRGILVRDPVPAYYIVEQRFIWGRKTHRRVGFLAALGLEPSSVRRVVPHEKTFSKPKRDRLRLLRALHANTSPVFALYPDPRGSIRRRLAEIARRPPQASGLAVDGVRLRVWRVDDAARVRWLQRAFRSKSLLIADGHHRLEVAKAFGGAGVLCCLCAREDPGLLVLPTHRVAEDAEEVSRRAARECRLRSFLSRTSLERAIARHPSPLAFGLIFGGSSDLGRRKFWLAVPKSFGAGSGVRSGLGVEWLARKILSDADPRSVRYTHDAGEAARLARAGGAAIVIKPVGVREIFRAVRRVGLLPQKSTYFYPKVEAGIVFNMLS